MSKTLEQLRTELAQAVARHFEGTATGGTTTTLIDTGGLARWTADDALKGALLYISTTTDSLAPQGESRRIEAYDESTSTITVSVAFSAAPASGDTYEIFLAPLTLDQWDGAINDAIRDAWPELFIPAIEEVTPTGALSYDLNAATDRVLGAELVFASALAGYPGEDLLQWYTVGEAGDITLMLSRPVPSSSDMTIRCLVGLRFDELTAGQSSVLDMQYIIDAARSRLYQRLADASRQSDRGTYLQLMAHWQGKGEQRLQRLASILWGEAPRESE